MTEAELCGPRSAVRAGGAQHASPFPIAACFRLPQAGARVGRRPIPQGPTYGVEVKSQVEVRRAGRDDSAGFPPS